MCLSIPQKIKKVKKQTAWLENGKKVNISLVPSVKIGDWVLAHKDLAISALTNSQAKKVFKLTNKCHHE